MVNQPEEEKIPDLVTARPNRRVAPMEVVFLIIFITAICIVVGVICNGFQTPHRSNSNNLTPSPLIIATP